MESEAAEANRRPTEPEALELEDQIHTAGELERSFAKLTVTERAIPGKSQRLLCVENLNLPPRPLIREWLRCASLNMDLELSGLSECDRSAEAFSRIMRGEGEEEPRPTWAEVQEREKRLSCLRQKIKEAGAVKRFADELAAKGEAVDEEFLRNTVECQRALWRAFVRVARSMRNPDFSGMTESDRAAEAEKLRQGKLQEARRLQEQGDLSGCRKMEALARIFDFDPKQGGIYESSFSLVDLATFDLSEESPIGPMGFTNTVLKDKLFKDRAAINILSVKIACSDIGFPIRVYGTVFARDCADYKRVYLFRRDSDHCQLINSKKEALILTGPKRGLALLSDGYVETDLWVKDHQGCCREFSRGILTIRGIVGRNWDICEQVETLSLATRLSTVDVRYEAVRCAVHATLAVEVLHGEFNGVMAAHAYSNNKRMIKLYDSEVADGNGHGVIQLMRPAVSVYFKDKLIFLAKTADGNYYKGINITPSVKGGNEIVLPLGDTTLLVKVVWSLIGP